MTITPTLRNKNSDSLLPCIVCIVCFEEVAVGSRQKKNPSMYSSPDHLYTEGTEQVVRNK